MRIGSFYSYKEGEAYILEHHNRELCEVAEAIDKVDAVSALRKISSEKTKPNLIFSPVALNHQLKTALCLTGWTEAAPGSRKGFREPRVSLTDREFREMDGLKNRVGLEIQFGKYAFMAYDVSSKMPIFSKLGLIDCGIEIVVMQEMLGHMSTGVSSYRQLVSDLEARGPADIDIPTLIIGIEPTSREWEKIESKRKTFNIDRERMISEGLVDGPRAGAAPGPK